MGTLTVLTIVWAAMALLIGGTIFATDPSTDAFYIPGVLLMISGMFASVAAALTLMRRRYTVALVMCIMSAVFGLAILLGLFGLFIARWIAKSKNEFAD